MASSKTDRAAVYLFFILFLLLPARAAELQINGDFKSVSGILPDQWSFEQWSGFLPNPRSKIVADTSSKNCLKIHSITGKCGTRILYNKSFPADSGGQLTFDFSVQGNSGCVAPGFYCLDSAGLRNGSAPFKYFLQKGEKQRIKWTFDIPDGIDGPTTGLVPAITFSRDGIFSIQDLKITYRPGEWKGAIPLPRKWMVFPCVPAGFSPAPKVLEQIPDRFAGHSPVSLEVNQNGKSPHTLDFSAVAGHAKGNRHWAFAAITATEECDYTIGAGADWWMKIYINGNPIIDTLKEGNPQNIISITNKIADVRLKRGVNIIAIEFIAGYASSELKIAGPVELRSHGHTFKLQTRYFSDDFESDRKRSGSPTIFKTQPTEGLIAETHAASYSGKSVSIHSETFRPIEHLWRKKYTALAFRLHELGGTAPKNSGKLSYVISGANNQPQFTLLLENQPRQKNIRIYGKDGNGTGREYLLPRSLLPCDILICFNRGEFHLSAVGISDNARYHFGFDAAELRKPTAFSGELTFSGTEVVLDNLETGEACYEREQRQVPTQIIPRETFNPQDMGWRQCFFDDFNGTQIDWTKWASHHWSSIHSSRNLSLDGKGHLVVSTAFDADKKLRTGSLWSKKAFRYGYFEAKLKFTRQPNWWAAFWLYGSSNSNPFLDGFEIDIFEDYYTRPQRSAGKATRILDFNLHSILGWGSNSLKSWNFRHELNGSLDDFHTVGLLRTPFEITLYIDGKLVRSLLGKPATFTPFSHALCLMPLHIIFSGQIMGATYEKTLEKSGIYPEYFLIDRVSFHEYPEHAETPWKKKPSRNIFRPGEIFEFEISPSPGSEKSVEAVYLFDSGYMIDFKKHPPFSFKTAIHPSVLESTAYTTPGRSGLKRPLDGFPHVYSAITRYQDGTSENTPPFVVIPAQPGTRPFQGKPSVLPGKLPLERFDEGGAGVAFYDVDPENRSKGKRSGGVDVSDQGKLGYICSGEWINYTISLKEDRFCKISARYGCPGYGGKINYISFLLNGKKITRLLLPQTNQNWSWATNKEVVSPPVFLPRGTHILTLRMNGAFNLESLEFRPESKPMSRRTAPISYSICATLREGCESME